MSEFALDEACTVWGSGAVAAILSPTLCWRAMPSQLHFAKQGFAAVRGGPVSILRLIPGFLGFFVHPAFFWHVQRLFQRVFPALVTWGRIIRLSQQVGGKSRLGTALSPQRIPAHVRNAPVPVLFLADCGNRWARAVVVWRGVPWRCAGDKSPCGEEGRPGLVPSLQQGMQQQRPAQLPRLRLDGRDSGSID